MGLLPWFPSAHNPCLVVNLCSYSAYTLAPLTYLALAAVAGHLHRPCLTLVLGVPLKSCPGVALATMLFSMQCTTSPHLVPSITLSYRNFFQYSVALSYAGALSTL